MKWSSSNHLALSRLELNESGFMSRYWHFLITHSLKRQGSHEQDESKINARWMLKVISDAPNRTESRSPRFCAQGIRSYGVSGNSGQNQIMISMKILTTAYILSTNLCSKLKVILNCTESHSPRFCAQGIWCWNYGVSGNSAQNQIMISMRNHTHYSLYFVN